MSKQLKFGLSIIIFIVVIIIAIVLFKSQNQHSSNIPVNVVSATTPQWVQYAPSLNVIGTLFADQGINLSSKIAGIVQSINFKSGQIVKKGQVLLILDSTDTRATLMENQARYKLAQQDFKRYEVLFKKKNVSRAVFDSYLSKLQASQAAVEYQQAILAESTIRAPFSGKLGIRQVSVGEYISAGQAIVNLQSQDKLYADFNIPERYVTNIKVGSTIQVTSIAEPDVVISGKVIALGSKVDVSTRSLSIRANLANIATHTLFPGMYVNVEIHLNKTTHKLAIPQSAIAYGPLGTYVYLIKNKHAVPEPVTVDARQNKWAIISKGIKINDQVVTSGQVKLYPGAEVSVAGKEGNKI